MNANTELVHPAPRFDLSRCIASVIVILGFIQARYWIGVNWPLLALFGLTIVLCLNEGHAPALGLRPTPIQGWIYWCRLALWFAVVIGISAALCTWTWVTCGWELPIHRTPPSVHALIHMCLDAPVSEEIIFRALLTLAVLPTLGERGTIIFGGLVFAALHVLHGNPGPDNQIAGFMLGWAFLKSGTILVPLAMHSTGNLIALGIQIAAWYFY